MNSKTLKLILLVFMVLQASCDITFKKKISNNESVPVNMGADKKEIITKTKKDNKALFNRKDSHAITSYYTDSANEIIRQDMVMHTKISKKQNTKLVVGKIIPRTIQVMPLPLKLERILSPLPLRLLRVQVDTKVILMDVRSRNILDVIKI